jgi:ribosome-associated toxin RatA of RatAB toxin-antitoxin module
MFAVCFFSMQTTVSQSNLFDHLNNEWSFKPGPTPNSCHLHFKVDFQFRSPLYRQVRAILKYALLFLKIQIHSF